jgi:arylsulfatase A-like enzyme
MMKSRFLWLVSIVCVFWVTIPAGLQADEAGSYTPSAESAASPLPYNMILIIRDQESYRLSAPGDYKLPAMDSLRRRGITFQNHYIAAAMCTPSRGVMFSGQPPQVNGVFDQMELGYVPSLRTDRPNMGTIMKQLGYTTAYYGKFELLRDIIRPSDEINYTDALREYGFDYFAPDGDKAGAPDQGYDTDKYSSALGVRWLRSKARKLNEQGKPWFLVVSLVSPHDIMYADANPQGERIQFSKIGATITPPPDNMLFKDLWEFRLSPSLDQPIDGPGRPSAQMQYHLGWSAFLGEIPNSRDDMWRIFYNYYLNLIRDSDRNLQMLFDTMDELELWKNTVVISTADHGELAGSHGGLRGKGPFPYEEMAHVPLVIAHPRYSGGQKCRALTSHIDLLPTLVGLSNARQDRRLAVTKGLPGRDFSVLLQAPEKAAPDSIRKAVLFNYVGLQTIEADYLASACKSIVESKWVPPLEKVHPDLSKRGFVSFAFDGRYKYARYYAPAAFNTPTTLEQILGYNDFELFDLKNDPHETKNLAVEAHKHKATILRMNALLNDLIAREVGVNDGLFLPSPVRPKRSVQFEKATNTSTK